MGSFRIASWGAVAVLIAAPAVRMLLASDGFERIAGLVWGCVALVCGFTAARRAREWRRLG